MRIRNDYRHTLAACFTASITQAIIVNFIPLLFITFSFQYGISLEKITLLVTINFSVQLLTDIIATKIIKYIGHRVGVVSATTFSFLGLIGLVFLPLILPPYLSLVVSMVICAMGGGLTEVLVSPIIEACPTKRKAAIMCLGHSFYCWGTALVIAISTLLFCLFGRDNWKALTLLWAIIPLLNTLYFLFVPIYNDKNEEHFGGGVKALFKSGTFWLFALLMLCAGACELSMGQWASAFAESALRVPKWVGDLIGPCTYALLMATARTLYAVLSDKMNLRIFIIISSALAILTYVVASFSQLPWLSLVACGLCGFATGILWPGTLSIATKTIGASTALFALYAVFGDLGATIGPTIVGMVSGTFNDDLRKGLACIIVFPIIIIIGMAISKKKQGK